MSSVNNSGRSVGCISIPIEIISSSSSNSPFRTFQNDKSYNHFSNSSPWKKSSINSYSPKPRFQPRPSPTTAYDRLINNSHFNNDRPLYQHQRIYEPNSVHFHRSNEDLLSSSNTSFCPPIFNNGFRLNSDFIQPNKHTNSFHRSYDILNDFSDIQQQSNEYRVPINHYQSNTFQAHDRSHSPASQRGESPTRPPPPSATSQQQESDFKVTKDTPNSNSTSGQTNTSSFLQSNDQQVPSTDIPISINIPLRDPNIIALEKLGELKQNLTDFNHQVDIFTGSTRDDRNYKVLDEQALKMMIRCDELIDVSSDIKEKRKEMIRNVQTVLAKLESKVPINSIIESNSNQMEIAIIPLNNNNTEQEKLLISQKNETSSSSIE